MHRVRIAELNLSFNRPLSSDCKPSWSSRNASSPNSASNSWIHGVSLDGWWPRSNILVKAQSPLHGDLLASGSLVGQTPLEAAQLRPGEAENRLKEQKLGFFADCTSCTRLSQSAVAELGNLLADH